jgi:8-oxo-dGTP pyrophosphatase MutT (NUDIX family)
MTDQISNPINGSTNDTGMAPRTTGRAVKPRHAATLILVRRDGKHPQVLMGRRAGGHDFMPDKWVFPGGRIDPSDYKAPYATDLRPEVAARLHHSTPVPKARALAMTAIRETFEEAGLLLAKPGVTRTAMGPWRDFLKQGCMPDLSALDYIGRAITPPMVPKRFDARFFMAEADRLISLERGADCGELDEIAWVNLDEALKLDLPTVTRSMIGEVGHRLVNPDRHPPFWRVQRGSNRFAPI